MSEPTLTATIDHVEIFVPDQHEAAAWYGRVLGFEIIEAFVHWAEDGPLMISSDGGRTKLALFRGPAPEGSVVGFRRLAFRLPPERFEAFVGGIEALNLRDDRGTAVTAESVVDHGLAHSIYFHDPWGHRLEVTTYLPAGGS